MRKFERMEGGEEVNKGFVLCYPLLEDLMIIFSQNWCSNTCIVLFVFQTCIISIMLSVVFLH